MNRPLRILLLLCLGALVVGGLAAQPAMAKKKEACWKTLINDWYDGIIDDKYKLHCYREALDHLDEYSDLQNYSTAREDINRAYQARIAEIRKARAKPTKPTKPSSGDKSQEIPLVPPGNPPTSPPGNETPPIPTPPPPTPATDPPGPATNDPKPTPQANEPGPKVTPLPTSPQPSAPQVVRNDDKGPIGNGIRAVGPSSADSLPIPLLVLGGLALLLMLGGVLGFLARRMQSRRPALRPATAPAETRRR